MGNNFYGLLEDNSVRKILLTQGVTTRIKELFVNLGSAFLHDDAEEIEFDGNYVIDNDEVLYVSMSLPDSFNDVAGNSIGIQTLNLNSDKIIALFWYDNGVCYFQNFDNRKLLKNKNVLVYSSDTYSMLSENAFIVDNSINAIYKNGKFYFKSYANANKIFSLMSFYQEATNEDITSFCSNDNIAVDEQWLKDNSNTAIRKQITLIQKSGILNSASPKKVTVSAKKFKLTISLDAMGKIILPNDKKACRDILTFLNEQYYIGLISGTKYRTNSKRTV